MLEEAQFSPQYLFANIVLASYPSLVLNVLDPEGTGDPISPSDSRLDSLAYHDRYLEFARYCANTGHLVRQRRVTCQSCGEQGADIEDLIPLLEITDHDLLIPCPRPSGQGRLWSSSRISLSLHRSLRGKCECVPPYEQLTWHDAILLMNALRMSGLVGAGNQRPHLPWGSYYDVQRTKLATAVSNADSNALLCKSCLENVPIAALPCGHLFQCARCWYLNDVQGVNYYRACPVCRTRVHSLQYIYIT